MNQLGKILVVAIFFLSVFFLAASLMIFATHENWKEKYQQTNSQLTTVRGELNSLQSEKEEIERTLAMERASRRQALAALESRLQMQTQELATLTTEYQNLQAQQRQATQAIAVAQDTARTLQQEAQQLRGEILQLREANANKLNEIVSLTDRTQQAEGTLQRLEQTNQILRDELGRATTVLRSQGLTPFTPVSNIAPDAQGEVQSVRDNRVVISLGSDDGIRVGHELDVHRGARYVGRVRVTQTWEDRSVAEILQGAFRRGAIMRGDHVRTKVGQ